MRNLLLFAILLCGVELIAQAPVVPTMGAIGKGILVKKVGPDSLYSPKEVELFALSSGIGPNNWCDTLVKKVKKPLLLLGYQVDSMNRSWVSWILAHSKDELIYVSGGYFNSNWGVGRIVDPFYANYTGWLHVTVFTYESCRVVLYKSTCANIVTIDLAPAQSLGLSAAAPAPPAPTAPIQTIMNINITLVNNITNITYASREPDYVMPAETWVGGPPPNYGGGGYYIRQENCVRATNVAAPFYNMNVDANYTEGNLCQKFRELRNQ
ncbi:MAG: hypothetical protein KBD52_00625 [Candidatus Pacebacteria bacterium]|nr:hypothetical protein [Candidatus Paceibacterota bacterium]